MSKPFSRTVILKASCPIDDVGLVRLAHRHVLPESVIMISGSRSFTDHASIVLQISPTGPMENERRFHVFLFSSGKARVAGVRTHGDLTFVKNVLTEIMRSVRGHLSIDDCEIRDADKLLTFRGNTILGASTKDGEEKTTFRPMGYIHPDGHIRMRNITVRFEPETNRFMQQRRPYKCMRKDGLPFSWDYDVVAPKEVRYGCTDEEIAALTWIHTVACYNERVDVPRHMGTINKDAVNRLFGDETRLLISHDRCMDWRSTALFRPTNNKKPEGKFVFEKSVVWLFGFKSAKNLVTARQILRRAWRSEARKPVGNR